MTTQISPFRSAIAVTPSDATIIPITRALWIGGAGAISVVTQNGDTVLISGIAAGTKLDLAVSKVNLTSTTATLIVALY